MQVRRGLVYRQTSVVGETGPHRRVGVCPRWTVPRAWACAKTCVRCLRGESSVRDDPECSSHCPAIFFSSCCAATQLPRNGHTHHLLKVVICRAWLGAVSRHHLCDAPRDYVALSSFCNHSGRLSSSTQCNVWCCDRFVAHHTQNVKSVFSLWSANSLESDRHVLTPTTFALTNTSARTIALISSPSTSVDFLKRWVVRSPLCHIISV